MRIGPYLTVRPYRFIYCAMIYTASVWIFGWWVMVPVLLIDMDLKRG